MAENFFDRFDDPSPKETNFFDRFDDPDPSPKDKQSSSYDPTENEGVFQEFFEGVGSGLTKKGYKPKNSTIAKKLKGGAGY